MVIVHYYKSVMPQFVFKDGTTVSLFTFYGLRKEKKRVNLRKKCPKMFSFSQEINRNSHYQTNLAYLNWIPLRKCNDLLIIKVNDMNWIENIWHILWYKIIKSTRCMWLSARFLACSSRTSFNCSRSSFAEWVIKLVQ